MTCCGNHCRNTIHKEIRSPYGKLCIEICDQYSHSQIECEVVNPFGKLLSEKVNAPWKNEIPNDKRDFINPNLWKIDLLDTPITPINNINICKDKSKSIFIYVLECASHKYYIGKTNNPKFRFEQHFTTNSTAWTTKYKPIRLYQLIPDCDDYDEDKYTLQYMEKYGINNVRGGSYSKLILDNNEIVFITKRIDSATDKCYKCGNSGHFVKDCDTITESSSSNSFITNTITQLFNCKYCYKEFATLKGTTYHEKLHCKNKPTDSKNQIKEPEINQVNLISSSLEDIIVYYCKYCNKEFDTLKGATGHENLYCKQKNNTTTNIKCFKCGREGHISNNCYATKHINKKFLS